MMNRRYRQLVSAMLGLSLGLGLMIGRVTLVPTANGGLPTISTLSGDPGSDPGSGG